MNYRHEWKHEITYGDMLILRQRLSNVMYQDEHVVNGKYLIRSLYFDNASDKALREKLDGVNKREKFRIRYYNGDTSLIRLEKKCKVNGLCLKNGITLSKEQAQKLVTGNYDWMIDSGEKLIQELYSKIMSQGLRPKTIVDYIREPFVFRPGNVRVTIDYNIRTSLNCADFLDTKVITIPVDNNIMILEVKWDEFLPDIISDVVQLSNCRVNSFSKYAVCRIYG